MTDVFPSPFLDPVPPPPPARPPSPFVPVHKCKDLLIHCVQNPEQKPNIHILGTTKILFAWLFSDDRRKYPLSLPALSAMLCVAVRWQCGLRAIAEGKKRYIKKQQQQQHVTLSLPSRLTEKTPHSNADSALLRCPSVTCFLLLLFFWPSEPCRQRPSHHLRFEHPAEYSSAPLFRHQSCVPLCARVLYVFQLRSVSPPPKKMSNTALLLPSRVNPHQTFFF